MDAIFGEYTYNIDDKGRLIVPPKFRNFLGETFVITRGLDGCLFGFPEGEWQVLQEKLSALPLADKKARAFTRFFYAGAAACAMDKQGRVGIPQGLRDFASLRKNVVIVGVTKRIEIWDKAKWQAYNEATAANLADAMADLGI